MTAAPVRGGARAGRTVVLGGSSLVLAAGAHLVGGAELPSATVLSVVGLVVGLVAVTLTARRCRLPVLLAVLGVEQVLLHEAFGASASVASGCGTGSTGHHAMAAACWSTPMTTGAMEPMGWSMLLGHAIATLLTAWLLARGEAWCWRVVDQVVRAASAAPAPWPGARARVHTTPFALALQGRHFVPAAPRGPPDR